MYLELNGHQLRYAVEDQNSKSKMTKTIASPSVMKVPLEMSHTTNKIDIDKPRINKKSIRYTPKTSWDDHDPFTPMDHIMYL